MNLLNKLLGRYQGHPEAIIISCYYNPTNSEYRRKAFDIWYKSIRHLNHHVVECVIGEGREELIDNYNISHVHTENLLWHKEALLNGIISKLPTKYKYVFWVDADVIFTNKRWLVEGVEKLQKGAKLIQPFEFCTHLGKDESKPKEQIFHFNLDTTNLNSWDSFCAIQKKYHSAANSTDYNTHGHVGFAWGAKRAVLEEVPLYDRALVGGADHIIAHAAMGQIPHQCITKSFTETIEEVEKWSHEFHDVVRGKVDYVKGDLYHIWHGDIKKREYLKRIKEFTPKTKQITRKDRNGLYVTGKPDDKDFVNYYNRRESVDDGFFNSMLMGYATDNPILGGMMGGNMAGGFTGASLRDDSPPLNSDNNPEMTKDVPVSTNMDNLKNELFGPSYEEVTGYPANTDAGLSEPNLNENFS